jgi:hypothetical protein
MGQGVTQRYRLFILANRDRLERKKQDAGSHWLWTAVHMEPKLNFGDLTLYI